MKKVLLIFCLASQLYSNNDSLLDTIQAIGFDTLALLDTNKSDDLKTYSLSQRLSFENGSSFFKNTRGGNSYTLLYGIYGHFLPLGLEVQFSRYTTSFSNKSAIYLDTSKNPIDTILGLYSENLDLYFLGALLGGNFSINKLPLRLNPQIGIGFLSFNNLVIQRYTVFDYRSFMPCLSAGLSIDYMLSSFFALRIGIRGYKAQTTSIVYLGNTVQLGSPLILNRLDTYLGLSLHFLGNKRSKR